MTSIEAHQAAPGFAVYAAMKAAVANLTASLALELAERGIRVNAIAPDAIGTAGDDGAREQMLADAGALRAGGDAAARAAREPGRSCPRGALSGHASCRRS